MSPALIEKLTYLGTKLPSFRDAHEALDQLLRTKLSRKRVERQTERIGAERVAQRAVEIAACRALPLVQRDRAPTGVKAPEVAAVLADGGRLQLCHENVDARPDASSNVSSNAKSHWHEYKAGVLQTLHSEPSTDDPCPALPAVYLRPEKIDKLAREITSLAAREEPAGPASSSAMESPPLVPSDPLMPVAEVIPSGYEPPEIIDRDVVATRGDRRAFGSQLAARAWSLGLFAALRFIHALTRIYAAALAGQSQTAGWEIDRRWITWTWSGEVAKVIAELAARQQELGLPTTEDGDTHPRRIVSETRTSLQNQQSRMNDPEYRKAGWPITSAHMESTVKLIHRRIKDSERYWSEEGAEDLLQLTADHLSTRQPLTHFWHSRPHQMTGTRRYAKSTG